jgi:hypothetical protein
MAQDGGKSAFGIIAGQSKGVGVTHTRCFDLYQHFVSFRSFKVYLYNFQWFASGECNSSFSFHLIGPVVFSSDW